MFLHPARRHWLTLLVLLSVLVFAAPRALAQDGDPAAEPITIGENKVGDLSAETPIAAYAIALGASQTLDIQALSLSPDFAPALQVYDASGLLLQAAPNSELETVVRIRALTLGAGTYRVEVSSASGQPGQFVLSAQAGEDAPAPVPLAPGETVEGEVTSDETHARYTFMGDETSALLLFVEGEELTGSPVISLKDATTFETLALSGAAVSGVRYRLPPGPAEYLLEVTNSGSIDAQAYRVCVQADTGSGPLCAFGDEVPPTPVIPTPTPIPQQPQPLPPLPSTGACVVASLTGGAVNVRSGPSTQFPPLFQISGNALAPVIGRLADSSWYQVNVNGTIGWISSSVIRIGGQCGSVTVIVPTPTSAATSATVTPTWTPDGITTVTPTWTPNGSATPTATDSGATQTWTPTYTETPAAVATLNFSLPPVYGSAALTSGFVPDPFTVGATGGGPADVSYLGGGCTGYTSSAPTFSVNYTAGAFPLLRFYFIGGGDTAMIINTPGGSYVCVDDSFGTLNPTIDFNSPSNGRYDIWIASFDAGSSIGGTLYITEDSANHP